MRVANHLPDPPIGLREADYGQAVILVVLRDVDGNVLVKPVVSTDQVWKTAEGLNYRGFTLSNKKLMELLRRVGC